MVLRNLWCPFWKQGVDEDGLRILLGKKNERCAQVWESRASTSAWTQGGVQEGGLARVTRLNKGQYQPILSHTKIPLLLLNVWTTPTVLLELYLPVPIILTVKDTNASWESKRKLNTSLSPPLDLLSWRTMAITNAFSCSSRNTCSAKGLSQLSADYCEGWFPPAELHWCSCLQRWDQLATQTGRREPFCTTAVVWKYPNVTRDGNLDLFLFSSISCSAQDSHMLSINYSLMSSLLTARAGGQHVHSVHRDGPYRQH